MDINLEKILRQRVTDKECIICGNTLGENIPTIILEHDVLGLVEICESHIKQSGNDE